MPRGFVSFFCFYVLRMLTNLGIDRNLFSFLNAQSTTTVRSGRSEFREFAGNHACERQFFPFEAVMVSRAAKYLTNPAKLTGTASHTGEKSAAPD